MTNDSEGIVRHGGTQGGYFCVVAEKNKDGKPRRTEQGAGEYGDQRSDGLSTGNSKASGNLKGPGVGIIKISTTEELCKWEDGATSVGVKVGSTEALVDPEPPNTQLADDTTVVDATAVFNDLMSKDIGKMSFYELLTYGCVLGYISQEERRQVLSMQRGVMNMLGFDLAQKAWELARNAADETYLAAVYNSSAEFVNTTMSIIGSCVEAIGTCLQKSGAGESGDGGENTAAGAAGGAVIQNQQDQNPPAAQQNAQAQQNQNQNNAAQQNQQAQQNNPQGKDWDKLYNKFEEMYEEQRTGEKTKAKFTLGANAVRMAGAGTAFALKLVAADAEQKAAYIRAELGLCEEFIKFVQSINQGISESIRTASDNMAKNVDMINQIVSSKVQTETAIIRNIS